jgi:hypothetical protein
MPAVSPATGLLDWVDGIDRAADGARVAQRDRASAIDRHQAAGQHRRRGLAHGASSN